MKSKPIKLTAIALALCFGCPIFMTGCGSGGPAATEIDRTKKEQLVTEEEKAAPSKTVGFAD